MAAAEKVNPGESAENPMTSAHVKAGQAIADLDWQPQTTLLLLVIFQPLLTQHQPRRIIPLLLGGNITGSASRSIRSSKTGECVAPSGPRDEAYGVIAANCQSGSWLTITILSLSYYGVDRKIKPYGCWRDTIRSMLSYARKTTRHVAN